MKIIHTNNYLVDEFQVSLFQIGGGVFRLADFVEECKHLLPLRIRVEEGFCGKDEQ